MHSTVSASPVKPKLPYQYRSWVTDTNGYQSRIVYDLADLFLPRRAGARPPVNFIAAGNNDVATLFELKSEPTF